MIFNRNIELIKRLAPEFLESLGFKVVSQDWYGLDWRGGTVSYLVRDKKAPNVLYMAWVQAWFGKLELHCIEAVTPGVVIK